MKQIQANPKTLPPKPPDLPRIRGARTLDPVQAGSGREPSRATRIGVEPRLAATRDDTNLGY